jgi:hypothetical protein
MADVFGWVVGCLGLVLSALGLWLTVVYGKKAVELLHLIRIKLEA